jgi:hypothetical protein
MILPRLRRTTVIAGLLALLGGGACTKKEAPPPVARGPEPTAAPATTLAPPPTTVPTPPPVWRTARWGMSKPDAMAAFPGEAQRLPQPAPFAQPQPGSSLQAGSTDVAIPSIDEAGVTFRALLGFGPAGLDRIHLAAIKPGAGTCEDVEKALTEKHGPPARRAKTGSSLAGDEVGWTLPDQRIVLSCAGVAALGFQTVSLDYLPPA